MTKRIIYTRPDGGVSVVTRAIRAALCLIVLLSLLPLGHARAESVLVYTRADGGVSVVTPAPALIMEFLRYGKATGTLSWRGAPQTSPQDVMTLADAEAAALALIRAKDVPADATDVAVVDRSTLPATRRFRDAWRKSGAVVSINLPAARAHRAKEIRAEVRQRMAKSNEDRALIDPVAEAALMAAHDTYQTQLRALLRSLNADLAPLSTPEAIAAWAPAYPADPGGPS